MSREEVLMCQEISSAKGLMDSIIKSYVKEDTMLILEYWDNSSQEFSNKKLDDMLKELENLERYRGLARIFVLYRMGSKESKEQVSHNYIVIADFQAMKACVKEAGGRESILNEYYNGV